MKRQFIATLSLAAALIALPDSAFAKLDNLAKDWQLQSLKGISSVDYGVAYDASGKLSKAVTDGLQGVSVPLKSITFKKDTEDTALAADAAQLKVFVDDRTGGKCWVGLSVKQKSKLERIPAVSYNAQTYSIGTLCPKDKVDASVKEICAQFVSDFRASNKK